MSLEKGINKREIPWRDLPKPFSYQIKKRKEMKGKKKKDKNEKFLKCHWLVTLAGK